MVRVVASLFDIHGRLSRGGFLVFVVCLAPTTALSMWLILRGLFDAAFLVVLPQMIFSLFAGIRRLHDRDRSGWWLLVIYAGPILLFTTAPWMPQVLAEGRISENTLRAALFGFAGIALLPMLWGFVELYLLPGTRGANRFGPDPRDRR